MLPLLLLVVGSSRSASWPNKEYNPARANVVIKRLVGVGFSNKTSLICNFQAITNVIMDGLVGSYSFIDVPNLCCGVNLDM